MKIHAPRPFNIAEYVNEQSLRDFMQRGELSPRQLINFFWFWPTTCTIKCTLSEGRLASLENGASRRNLALHAAVRVAARHEVTLQKYRITDASSWTTRRGLSRKLCNAARRSMYRRKADDATKTSLVFYRNSTRNDIMASD